MIPSHKNTNNQALREMDRHKSKMEVAYQNKRIAKQDYMPSVVQMALSGQPLNISTLLNEDGPSKVLIKQDDYIHQDSKKTTKSRRLSDPIGTKKSDAFCLTPCASKGPSTVCLKQIPIEYPSRRVSQEDNIQALATKTGHSQTSCTYSGDSPILQLTSDLMAEILVFLEPSQVLEVVSFPLCKRWIESYTHDHDLWKVLCTLEPFKVRHAEYHAAEKKQNALHYCIKVQCDQYFKVSRHRLLYISFVRCENYLRSLKEGNRNAETMKPIDRSIGNSLRLAYGEASQRYGVLDRGILDSEVSPLSRTVSKLESPQGTKRHGSDTSASPRKKPRYGKSMITSRLLGPSAGGAPSHLNLPRSCAIFSVVNWMVAHVHVEGIQTMCIEALPQLLEDERHRMTAQRAGLADAIFRAMVAFPDSVNLHSAAFHTLVLLGRPLGGQEGMIIDFVDRPILRNLSVGSVAYLNLEGTKGNQAERRIPIVLNSMRRFEHEEELQTRACWALVNLALVPSQRDVIIRNNGIELILQAMQNHPKSHGVQFRALFALINLAVPCTKTNTTSAASEPIENKILDTCVGRLTKLVVAAVMNFPSSSLIRNKASLVLHNLSLSIDYMSTLMWTRHCYKLLCWSIKNHTDDQVLQRSSIAAIRRMNEYMRHREVMESEFASWIESEPELPASFHGNRTL